MLNLYVVPLAVLQIKSKSPKSTVPIPESLIPDLSVLTVMTLLILVCTH